MAVITCNDDPGCRAVITVRGNEFSADIARGWADGREKINGSIKGRKHCSTESKIINQKNWMSLLRGEKWIEEFSSATAGKAASQELSNYHQGSFISNQPNGFQS